MERLDYKTVNKKTLENLITAGGLDSFGLDRSQYFYMPDGHTTFLENLVNYGQKKQQDSLMMQATLFGGMDEYDVKKPSEGSNPSHSARKVPETLRFRGFFVRFWTKMFRF